MDQHAGVTGLWHDGVFFTETPCDEFRSSPDPVSVEISRQNADLRQVRSRLAQEVTKRGGNALVGFEYGQRSHSIWQQLFTFKWDTESWHGRGYVARLQ